MSAPVINTTTSILEYLQWQSWEFQPYASNSPTGWICSPLPPGLTIDTPTGLISGAATKPGVFNVALTALNSDGASDALNIAIGIEASTAIPPVDAVELVVDLGTSEVSTPTPSARKVDRIIKAADGSTTTESISPLFWLKLNDKKLVHVRYVKGGVTSAIVLATLALSAKVREPEGVLVSSSTFAQADTGENTFYRMEVGCTGTALTNELADSADDDGTDIASLMELQWTWANVLTPKVGPDTLLSSSLYFWVGIQRDLNTPPS